MSECDLTESLRAADRRLQAAQRDSDVQVLDELLDDRLLYTSPDGTVFSKSEDLEGHRRGVLKLRRVDEVELAVLVSGSTGVTWFRGLMEGHANGDLFSVRMRYTRTWVHEDTAGWRVVAAHASMVTD